MCRPLTVTCLRDNRGTKISDHFMTFGDKIVPCKAPGSEACFKGETEPVNLQNPPTMCAGLAAGYEPGSQSSEDACAKALYQYGQALYSMHVAGPKKTPVWKSWVRSWEEWVAGDKGQGYLEAFQEACRREGLE